MENTKSTKRYRLQSVLKLHNRIMNDRLKVIAATTTANLETFNEDVKKSKDPLAAALYSTILDIADHLIMIGSLNYEVIKQSKDLTLASSQEELASLFKLVTKKPYKHKEELVKEAKAKMEDKNSKPDTSTVTAKVIEIVASSKEEALEKFKQLMEEGKIK